MESPITDLIDRLATEIHENQRSCDVSSSRVHLVNTPIPVDLYYELEGMSRVFKQDTVCLAGELLTIAIKEILENFSEQDRINLNDMKRVIEFNVVNRHREAQQYDAGAT